MSWVNLKPDYHSRSSAPSWCCGAQSSSTVSRTTVRNLGWRMTWRRSTKRVLLTIKDAPVERLKLHQSSANVCHPLERAHSASKRRQERWRTESVPETEYTSLLNDEQAPQVHEEGSRQFWDGSLPGYLAEVEAFCRIFRLAEQLHNTVMDALCTSRNSNKIQGPSREDDDGISLHSSEVSDGEDMPLLEEKVVAGVGCIEALLHQESQKVLWGRLRNLDPSQDSPGIPEDELTPPLAHFRAKMKKCCKQLEVALCNYFPPVDGQNIVIHKRFQRLRNACFDAGYSRSEGCPSHADVPNWAVVSVRTLETDDEVSFWSGGQITDEGLKWLLDNGMKMIVDLRAEDGMDQLAQSAIASAVCSGHIRLVRLPVEPRTAPTKEQVEEFARLLADPGNHPLYLHSQEGVGRTSAMVLKLHELSLPGGSPVAADVFSRRDGSFANDFLDDKGQCGRAVGGNVVATVTMDEDFDKLSENKWDGSNSAAEGSNSSALKFSSVVVEHCDDNLKSKTENSAHVRGNRLAASKSRQKTAGTGFAQVSLTERFAGAVSPFEAQRPSWSVLSRQPMSQVRKVRRVVPAGFLFSRRERETDSFVSSSSIKEGSVHTGSIAGPAGRWGLAGPGIPMAGITSKDIEPDIMIGSQQQEYLKANDDTLERNVKGSVSLGAVQNIENYISRDGETVDTDGNDFTSQNKKSLDRALFRAAGDEEPADDSDDQAVVGDMCASTTGVVRLQSRKKAEMYLVRTDGHSCTREKVRESTLAFTHPSTQQQMLMWKTAPKTVLLLKKLGSELMEEAQEVVRFLYYKEGMNVVVEPEVHDRFARLPGFGFVQTFYNQDTSDLHERVDFVVCLGGDGVILHASNLFRNAVPPVVSFNLGSLGFLTAHPFGDFKKDLHAIIHGNSRVGGVYITLRMRLRCQLYRNGKPIPGKVFDILNEVVVDRGSSPYLCKIEFFEHNRLITKVQADGVIVATPTGSTAYSTSAGGSMVHPNVPCMLFTPICPHSLSFRPVILPDSALLELKVPSDARSNAWVSFDGKRRQQLSKGDSVRVCMSEHPLPTVNKSDQTDDWFRSLVRCLNWNERLEQKELN